MHRTIMMMLFVGATAFAQTTTTLPDPTCTPSTQAALLAAVAVDHDAERDWNAVLGYAAKRHFDTAAGVQHVTVCTDGVDTLYLGLLNSRLVTKPAATISFDPNGGLLTHTELIFQKSAHLQLSVTAAVINRAYLNRDGTVRLALWTNLRGKRIRPPVEPLAARRHL